MPMRVAAYCRVSTDQEDQRNSLQNQKQFFDEYIKRNPDWELVQIYADEGITGTSIRKRREFQKMITAAEHGELDLILTKEVSRFSRNTIDTIAHTRRMQALGVGIVFINDGIDTRDRDGELRLTLMASIAQEESRKTSERTKWGQKRSMERGVVFGNDSTYGYETKKGALTVRPVEAETVRRIYHKFLHEGKGTHVIARELYEAGIQPPKTAGKPWSSTMIHRILCNEKYCGDLLQRKYVTVDFLSHKKILNQGQEEKIYLRDHHEAIISRTLFEQTQRELARRASAEEAKTRYSNRYWCSGKIRCGCCGSRFVLRQTKRPDGDVYRSWSCHARAQYGNWKKNKVGDIVGCNMRMVNDKTLMECVRYVLQRLDLDREEMVSEVLREVSALKETAPEGHRAEEIRRMMEAVQRKKVKVMDAYFSEEISLTEMDSMKKRYDAEMEKLQKHMLAEEHAQAVHRRQTEELSKLRVILQEELQTSREVFGEVVEQIRVYEAYIEVDVRYLQARFRLWYTTGGRGASYQTVIQRCELVSGEMQQAFENTKIKK